LRFSLSGRIINGVMNIPEQLSHPIALRTEGLLASCTEDHTNRILPINRGFFYVCVSRTQVSRALRIWNSLLFLLEEQGCRFSWPEEENSSLSIIVDGETLRFGICEIFNAKPHVLTRAEEKNPFLAPQWDHQLTGKVQLFIGQIPYASKGRRSWSDGRHHVLEQCLESFAAGLRVAAAAMKKTRLEKEERERQVREEQKREESHRMLAIEQDRRARVVTGLLRDWHESQSL